MSGKLGNRFGNTEGVVSKLLGYVIIVTAANRFGDASHMICLRWLWSCGRMGMKGCTELWYSSMRVLMSSIADVEGVGASGSVTRLVVVRISTGHCPSTGNSVVLAILRGRPIRCEGASWHSKDNRSQRAQCGPVSEPEWAGRHLDFANLQPVQARSFRFRGASGGIGAKPKIVSWKVE